MFEKQYSAKYNDSQHHRKYFFEQTGGGMSGKKTNVSSREKTSGELLGKTFVQNLLIWNKKKNKRQMPWKGEKDPYKIWLSEIILQQTRVEQGLKYYDNFIKAFPDVHSLANAPESTVFKLWEGLGYYSRCRNLITSARFISGKLGGVFPQDFESILQLKGVGTYTASAIASFAYNLPYAVLDGNVFRVISRIYGIETPIDSTEGKVQFSEVAQEMLPKKKAGEYNQAIMDFGAVVCKPQPECRACFFRKQCKAYLAGKQDLLPIKEKKIKIKERWLNYFVVKFKDQVLVRQRVSKDIWQQLYEFVLIETAKPNNQKQLLDLFRTQYQLPLHTIGEIHTTKQKLSHQLIHFSFVTVSVNERETIKGFSWLKLRDLDQYPFPKTLLEFVTAHLR
ncbi:MAG: A/G-specific adenine glycosylase [Flavisolibacter sp.]